ncbi:MAG: FtsX-like permease family protein [Promethearchaeota archaeon]
MIVNEGELGEAIYMLIRMGFFVALAIFTVVMYQSIQEKIPELGTLKILGCSKGFINKMLLEQTFIYITIIFVLGSVLAILFDALGLGGDVPIIIDLFTSLILYFIYLHVSIVSSLVSIKKVHRIDPAIVLDID